MAVPDWSCLGMFKQHPCPFGVKARPRSVERTDPARPRKRKANGESPGERRDTVQGVVLVLLQRKLLRVVVGFFMFLSLEV